VCRSGLKLGVDGEKKALHAASETNENAASETNENVAPETNENVAPETNGKGASLFPEGLSEQAASAAAGRLQCYRPHAVLTAPATATSPHARNRRSDSIYIYSRGRLLRLPSAAACAVNRIYCLLIEAPHAWVPHFFNLKNQYNWVAHLVCSEQTVHMPDGFAGGDAAKMQVDLLQNLVARLQTELSKYVTLAEIDKAAEADPDLDLAVLLSWQTSTEHISPLLTAYDGRIRELEAKLAESSHTRMDDRSLIEQLNQKNQKLTSELQKSIDGLIKKTEDAGAGLQRFTFWLCEWCVEGLKLRAKKKTQVSQHFHFQTALYLQAWETERRNANCS
jgi:hypothetical protein